MAKRRKAAAAQSELAAGDQGKSQQVNNCKPPLRKTRKRKAAASANANGAAPPPDNAAPRMGSATAGGPAVAECLATTKLLKQMRQGAFWQLGPSGSAAGGDALVSTCAPTASAIASAGTPSVASVTGSVGAAKAAQRAASAEIDDIFAKRRRPTMEAGSGRAPTPAAAERRGTGTGSRPRARVRQPKHGSAKDPLGRGDEWVNDGLGGVYNKEGWTGRKTPGDKLRIFKAHLLQVGAGGGTPLCPFDCECCF
mmetsp:Transcript_142823/g.397845  ORF Transcript_142823/g.397845 Transcript_142823/m.397845 type:complete len:253 (+) Transcript_142823:61-819(+)